MFADGFGFLRARNTTICPGQTTNLCFAASQISEFICGRATVRGQVRSPKDRRARYFALIKVERSILRIGGRAKQDFLSTT